MQSSPVRNRLMLASAALLFSTGGAAIKAVSFSAWQVASFRSGVAAIFLFGTLPEARKGWSWRMAPAAAAYAATLLLFVLLLGPWLLDEPVRRADLFYILAVAAGMSMFFLGARSAAATAPSPARGNL